MKTRDLTGPGRRPWGHQLGSASCGRPPSPPQSVPWLPAGCCTASSSRPPALSPPSALYACLPRPAPERRRKDQSWIRVWGDQPRETRGQTWKATVPSLVSPSSSLRSPNHCCQSGASCSSCSSFSSSSLLPSCLDASENGASFHHWDLLHLQVISGSLFKSEFCLLYFFFECHLLPGGTWAALPLQRIQVLLQTEHSPSCSWAKREKEKYMEIIFKKFQMMKPIVYKPSDGLLTTLIPVSPVQ